MIVWHLNGRWRVSARRFRGFHIVNHTRLFEDGAKYRRDMEVMFLWLYPSGLSGHAFENDWLHTGHACVCIASSVPREST